MRGIFECEPIFALLFGSSPAKTARYLPFASKNDHLLRLLLAVCLDEPRI